MSRVNPPKTIIPKTLAALANSQYATTFSVVLGKLDLAPSFNGLVADAKDADLRIGLSLPFHGAPLESGLNLSALETEETLNGLLARIWRWTHCLQVKNSLENRGARLLNMGTADRKEAIVGYG